MLKPITGTTNTIVTGHTLIRVSLSELKTHKNPKCSDYGERLDSKFTYFDKIAAILRLE